MTDTATRSMPSWIFDERQSHGSLALALSGAVPIVSSMSSVDDAARSILLTRRGQLHLTETR